MVHLRTFLLLYKKMTYKTHKKRVKSNSGTSTLASRPVKLKQILKPKIQTNLEFHDAVIHIIQRSRALYQSN